MAGPAAQVLGETGASLKPEVFGRALVVPVAALRPNVWNPNRQDEATFRRELASIRRFGFVDPIIVRKDGAKFEIIDGEHRWKAAQELGFVDIPVFDIGPISEHEARQLTVVLNELRGKPDDKRMAELLRGLLAKSTVDELIEVMPWNKDQFAKVAQLPEFDWDGAREKLKTQGSGWVERIFRLSSDAAKVLDRALVEAKEDEPEMSDAEALEAIAAEFLS